MNRAILKIGRHEYEVLHMNYKFDRNIDHRWPDYPWGWDHLLPKDAKYVSVSALETEVSEIEMVTPLTKMEYCENPGMDLHKEYKLRVKSYTNGKPWDTNRIRWEYSYVNIKGEMVTGAFKEQRGEELIFHFNDAAAVGNVISFFAYISTPKGEGECQIYANPLWRYKGTKQWGKLGSSKLEMLAERRSYFDLCFDLDDSGKERALQLSLMPESIVRLAYEYAMGPRQVLSDDDNVEQRVIDNFYNSNGQKLSFGSTSVLSQKLHVTPTFQAYFKRYLNVILNIIQSPQWDITTIDGENIASIFIGASTPDFSKIKEILDYDYYGLMGGTQRITVDLDIIQTNATRYMVKTRMYIGDWYGADKDDINGEYSLKGMTPSLSAFFWLQHHYGYQPFETEIVFDSVDVITLEKEVKK